MTPLWLCLFFTFYFIAYAFEKTDNDNVSGLQEPNSNLEGFDPALEDLRGFLSKVITKNATESQENLEKLFQTKNLPEPSTIRDVANATERTILEIEHLDLENDFFKIFIQPLLRNPTLRRKREDNVPSDRSLNEENNLPINRILDATDQLFNQTAFIDKMTNQQGSNSINDQQFAPINQNKVENRNGETYANPLKLDFKNQINDQKNLPEYVVSKYNKEIKLRMDGPLVTSALSLIEKIQDLTLKVLERLKDNKNLNGKIFAASALTAFSIAVSVSASKAFYTGYRLCEKICKFFTGRNSCNLFDYFTIPVGIKNAFSNFSELLSFGKGLLKFRQLSLEDASG